VYADAQVLLRAAIVRRGCKQSGQLARVKQREWKESRYDRGGTRNCSPRVYTLGYFLPPRLSRGSRRSQTSFPSAIRSELLPTTGSGLSHEPGVGSEMQMTRGVGIEMVEPRRGRGDR
jgi:hypothetical protein